MNRYSIIIVSWNGLQHLQRFLPSVCQSDWPEVEIILADNASDDGSREWVARRFPQVKIVALDRNYGYCGGNNRAAKHASGQILVFLNNDAEVTPDWLKGMDRLFDSKPEVAVVQPKILDVMRRDYFEYAGAAGGFIDRLGYPFCRGRVFDTIEPDRGQYGDETPVFWASGAAMAIRREVFEELGGFDESFEFHMEEIDLCWRVHRAGWQVWYTGKSTVYHLGGGSLPADSPRKVYYNFRNNLVMLIKNLPDDRLWRTLIKRVSLDKIAMFRFLAGFQFRHAWAIMRALFAVMSRLPDLIQQRSGQTDKLPETMQLVTQPVVWQYFLKKRRTFPELR